MDHRPAPAGPPAPAAAGATCAATAVRSPLGTFVACPLCDGALVPEHAHFRCPGCGWRDSCCD